MPELRPQDIKAVREYVETNTKHVDHRVRERLLNMDYNVLTGGNILQFAFTARSVIARFIEQFTRE